MRTLFLAAILIGTALDSFAQGQLWFANNAATTITNGLTGLPAAGGPAQDDTQVGLYLGDIGAPLSSLQLATPVTNCYIPGRFNGWTRSIAGRWIEPVQIQIRAWLASTVYPTYEAAFLGALSGDDSVLLGVSVSMIIPLDFPPGTPAAPFHVGLDPIVLRPIPEPSALALGLLGLGALLAFRRRQ